MEHQKSRRVLLTDILEKCRTAARGIGGEAFLRLTQLHISKAESPARSAKNRRIRVQVNEQGFRALAARSHLNERWTCGIVRSASL